MLDSEGWQHAFEHTLWRPGKLRAVDIERIPKRGEARENTMSKRKQSKHNVEEKTE
jgi:hypothetical protein